MEIKVNCSGKENVFWEKVEDMQGPVKELPPERMQKLLNSLANYGFCEPLSVWKDPSKEGRIVCLAGNQRLKALKKAKEMGWDIPDMLPASEIKANNELQAKKILLSLASQYGKFNQEASFTFIKDLKLDSYDDLLDTINFPEIDLSLDSFLNFNPKNLDNSEERPSDYLDKNKSVNSESNKDNIDEIDNDYKPNGILVSYRVNCEIDEMKKIDDLFTKALEKMGVASKSKVLISLLEDYVSEEDNKSSEQPEESVESSELE